MISEKEQRMLLDVDGDPPPGSAPLPLFAENIVVGMFLLCLFDEPWMCT
jgi:hypothetical protein